MWHQGCWHRVTCDIGDADLNSTDNPKRELSKTKIYFLYFSYSLVAWKKLSLWYYLSFKFIRCFPVPLKKMLFEWHHGARTKWIQNPFLFIYSFILLHLLYGCTCWGTYMITINLKGSVLSFHHIGPGEHNPSGWQQAPLLTESFCWPTNSSKISSQYRWLCYQRMNSYPTTVKYNPGLSCLMW